MIQILCHLYYNSALIVRQKTSEKFQDLENQLGKVDKNVMS